MPNKTSRIDIRLTDEQKAVLVKKVRESGLSQTAFVVKKLGLGK